MELNAVEASSDQLRPARTPVAAQGGRKGGGRAAEAGGSRTAAAPPAEAGGSKKGDVNIVGFRVFGIAHMYMYVDVQNGAYISARGHARKDVGT